VNPKTVEIHRLIEQIAAAWPRRKMLIVTSIPEEASAIHAKLDRRFEHVELVKPTIPSHHTRILVGAAGGIGRHEAQLEKVSIVILLDATILARDQPYQNLLDNTGARIYGILQIGKRLRPLEEDRIANLLGFNQLTLWHHGQIDQPVIVQTVTNRNGTRLTANRTIADVKRLCIWSNHRRNLLISTEANRQLADLRK
jgi:hypothetical protein